MGSQLTGITFKNFKALENFSVSFSDVNILIGPNNSGKSTIISSFRLLNLGLRKARSERAQQVTHRAKKRFGFPLDTNLASISLENVSTNYNDEEAEIVFTLGPGEKLFLYFPDIDTCIFTWDFEGKIVNTPTLFKKAFDLVLQVVPVLGPLEHVEKVLTPETIRKNLDTHLASRHFRNYWRLNMANWEDFKTLIESSWSGMEIKKPETEGNDIKMFCSEKRFDREIFWAGFGFQIWCQLLTHLSRARNSDVLIVDEPEIYLHPEIQRQLMAILRDLGCRIVVATHSVEIISDADPSEILLVDKTKKFAQRLKDVKGMQRAIDYIGSTHNIKLAQLARNRRMLFLEGTHDFRIYQKMAKRLGKEVFDITNKVTAFESGGFQSWRDIKSFAWGIDKTVDSKLAIATVYDRDYYCDEEIAEISAELNSVGIHVYFHRKKEIENYLLSPRAVLKAIQKLRPEVLASDLEQIYETGFELLRKEAQGQYISQRTNFLKPSWKADTSTLTIETIELFEIQWKDIEVRLAIVPGKAMLAYVRNEVQEKYGVSLSDMRLIDAFPLDELGQVATEFVDFIGSFAGKKVYE